VAFREQIVELHRAGRSVEDLAREFGPCVATIHTWIRQADRDGGRGADMLSTEEWEELRRLRRENRQLRQERDILLKAAAWFAQNDVTGPRSSSS
jgi:transposase